MVRFWFPPEDDGLVGSRSARDPLGFLPIWSQRGRSVVPNLTEQTNDARGFQLLITALRLWEEFQASNKDAQIRVEEFFLLVEQAFAFSTRSREGKWPLPGRERVDRFTRDGAPRLSLKTGILANQLGNGVWGLYRGAALRSGILHESMRCLSAAFRQEMGDELDLPRRFQKELFRLVLDAKESRGEGVEFSLHGGRQLPTCLSDILMRMPQKPLLRRYLFPAGSLHERVAGLLYEHRQAFRADRGYRRAFMTLCATKFPEEREAFENIVRCEDLIAPVENVFYRLFHFIGEPASTAAAALDVDMGLLTAALDRFGNSGIYTAGTARRFAIYRDNLRTTSKEELVRSILACHERVAVDRRREPWISEENNRLRAFYQVDGVSEDLDAVPSRTWLNDYYLFPLLEVHTRLRA